MPIDLSAYVFVYFFEAGDFIKIGYSRDWRKRLANVRVSCPLEVTPLLVEIQSTKHERAVHQKFKKYHHRAEWFHAAPEIKEYIAQRIIAKRCVKDDEGWKRRTLKLDEKRDDQISESIRP